MDTPKRTLIVSGQARVPKALSANQVIQVVAELDAASNEVINVNVHPSPPIIQKFLHRVMIGIRLEAGLNEVLDAIEHRLIHPSKAGIITALKDLFREFEKAGNVHAPHSVRRVDGYKW
jgi:hypothetical protein